jgi:hypothetical protein
MPVTKKRLAEFDKMSEEELEAALQKMHEERLALRDEQLAAHEALDRKVAERQAVARLETMNPAEVEALMQYVETHGIPTQEQVQGEEAPSE